MSPVLLLTVLGLPQSGGSQDRPPYQNRHSDADNGVPNFDGFVHLTAWGGVLWRPVCHDKLFWNLNRSTPRGISPRTLTNQPSTMMLPEALMCNLLPLLVALGATDAATPGDRTDGYMRSFATEVVGPWPGAFTVFGLSADAFQLMDMDHVPTLFRIQSVHGTPTFGIILGTAGIVVMGISHFDQLIEMRNFNYSISLLRSPLLTGQVLAC
jgi:hypothetical protein